MFIDIADKKDLIEKLKENLYKKVVFHYHCSHCQNDQVTYDDVLENDMIDHITNNNGIVACYDCTDCGLTEIIIHVDAIFGLEIM